MNIHEKITDARRMQLRKSMLDVAQFCNEISQNNFLDTERVLKTFIDHANGVVSKVNEAGEKAAEEIV